MSTVIVIPCSASKRTRELPAAELYSSAHFDYTLEKAELIAADLDAEVLILSAKYGLLDLDSWIKPYDVKIGDSGSIRSTDVADQLRERGITRMIAFVPKAYRYVLELACHTAKVQLVNGYAGCQGIGEQRGRLATVAEYGLELPAPVVPAAPPRPVDRERLDLAFRANEAANVVGSLADELRELEAAAAAKRAELAAAVEAAARVNVPERQLAELAGVARGTVRSWLGRSVA